jgi:GNAT superfamily N-acetyltransferase
MLIRLEKPASTAQYGDWAAILERVSGDVFGVDELAHALETDRESAWILAYLGGEAAGIGVGKPSSIAGSLYAMARVLPEHRRRGVGSALYGALSAHARRLGRTSLWGRIRVDDAESRRFAEQRGFTEVGREYEVVLDVERADVSPEPPPGIEIVSLAERPDLARAVHDVDTEVTPDAPTHEEEHEPMSFERWHDQYLEGPGAVPEALMVAVAAGQVVGYAGLRRRGAVSPIAEHQFTAVRRQWRRRGIATALKRAQIERVYAMGIKRLFTTNEETNVAMRRVNARLGYLPEPAKILVSGPLAAV